MSSLVAIKLLVSSESLVNWFDLFVTPFHVDGPGPRGRTNSAENPLPASNGWSRADQSVRRGTDDHVQGASGRTERRECAHGFDHRSSQSATG